MKANEIEDGKVLMIGDFVIGCIETDIVGEATYKILCKVTDINHYGDVSCEALESLPDELELDWQDGDDFSWIEPIPLTPEILEKNGFVKQEDGCFRYFKPYDENYYIGFESIFYLFERKTAKITKEHSQSGLQEKVEFTCKYLHELQHALRLCGIEKTIEL